MSDRIYWSTHLGETYVEREGSILWVSADCGLAHGSIDLSEKDGLSAAIATRDLLTEMIEEASK